MVYGWSLDWEPQFQIVSNLLQSRSVGDSIKRAGVGNSISSIIPNSIFLFLKSVVGIAQSQTKVNNTRNKNTDTKKKYKYNRNVCTIFDGINDKMSGKYKFPGICHWELSCLCENT